MGWLPVLLGVILLASACSRQQSDWDKARTANSVEAYQQFVKNYPSGDFTAQAQARIKELEEERDWQKARDTDTPDGYQAFLKQYPEGKWTEEARIRIENFSLAQPPAGSAPQSPGAPSAAQSQESQSAPTAAEESPVSKALAAKPAPHKPAASAKQASTKPKSAAKIAHASSKSAGKAGASGHHYAVQLGAFGSGKPAAEHDWNRLTAAHPTLFKGLQHRVVSATSTNSGSKHTLYKLQATGLSHERARAICHALAAKKQSCLIIAP